MVIIYDFSNLLKLFNRKKSALLFIAFLFSASLIAQTGKVNDNLSMPSFRIRDGGHTWTYWRTALPTVLSFVSDAFHQY